MKEQLKALCVAAGLPWNDEVPDACVVEMEGGLVIMCQADEQTGDLLLEIALTPLPPEGREAVTSMIAAANYRGMLTDGACLGLDPASGSALLFRRIPMVALEAAGFVRLLTRLLDVAEQMNAALQTASSARAARPPLDSAAARVNAPTHYQMSV